MHTSLHTPSPASHSTTRARETRRGWRLATIAVALAATALTAHASGPATGPAVHHHIVNPEDFSPLVEKVRVATSRFIDVNIAKSEGWVPGTPCVSGPSAGAMGVHFILNERIGDGILNPVAPEALIYEPVGNGALRLVGVEFIVLASDWARLHPDGSTPAVDGHLTHYVGEPNRYGLPAFYELHVWAWEHNPSGTFADWNTQVSCDLQPTPQ